MRDVVDNRHSRIVQEPGQGPESARFRRHQRTTSRTMIKIAKMYAR